MLNNNKMRVEWDQTSKKEVEEAKTKYRQARQEHRKMLKLDGEELLCFRPDLGGFFICEKQLKEGQFAARIIDDSGDRRLVWDSNDHREVEEAFKTFQDYIDKGWRAYAVGEDGQKGRRIHRFSADRQEVFFDETGVGTKIRDFIDKISEVRLAPKTYPG
jgi:hypothetical protein